jgi:hypothetical protein
MAIETTQAIIDRLVDQGVGVYVGPNTNLFFSRLPSQPDAALSVRPMGGAQANRAFGDIPAVRYNPDVHITLRHPTIDGIAALVFAVRNALDFKIWIASGGEEFFTWFSYEPVDLGEDENQREIRSVVVDIKRTI